jgi:predicted Zn finger-like uncharacterized protein
MGVMTMIIQCSSCGTKFRFDDSKIASGGVKLKCSKCSNVFIVKKPSEQESPAPVPAVNPAASPPPVKKAGPPPSAVKATPPPGRQATGEPPAADTATCPYCKKAVPPETHFCPHCGEDVTRKAASAKQPASVNKCPACGAANSPESRFCNDCGKPLQKPQKVVEAKGGQISCPKCGAKNSPEVKFCAECGTKFAKSPASDEPTLTERMKKMYEDQGLDAGGDAGGTLFPFTAGWGDEYSGDTVKRKGEEAKLILKLRVIAGPDEGKEYIINKKRTIIGRADADIIIDDFKTSRNHAEIEMLGYKFLLKDLESTNGTFLNGNMTPADFLSHDDQIQISDSIYQVLIEEENYVK